MMTLEQKKAVFKEEYELYGWEFDDTVKYLSLVGALYKAATKKSPDLTVFELLKKIYKEDDRFDDLFERTEIHLSSIFIWGSNFNTYGLISPKDISAEIRMLLDSWLPF